MRKKRRKLLLNVIKCYDFNNKKKIIKRGDLKFHSTLTFYQFTFEPVKLFKTNWNSWKFTKPKREFALTCKLNLHQDNVNLVNFEQKGVPFSSKVHFFCPFFKQHLKNSIKCYEKYYFSLLKQQTKHLS